MTDNERARASRFGADEVLAEREQYKRWRDRVLHDERDDLALRARLLTEQAEALRNRAADLKMDAQEKLTPADWAAHDQAKADGKQPEPLDDRGAAGLEAQAERLEAEAQEIAQHLEATRSTA
jgi:hypothetical protein